MRTGGRGGASNSHTQPRSEQHSWAELHRVARESCTGLIRRSLVFLWLLADESASPYIRRSAEHSLSQPSGAQRDAERVLVVSQRTRAQ